MESIFDNDNLILFDTKAFYGLQSVKMAHHEDRKHHGFAFKVKGKCRYTFSDGTVLTTEANKIIYLPKHSTYQVEFLDPGEYYAINFDIIDDKTYAPFVTNVKNSTMLLNLFKSTFSAWAQKPQGYQYKCMKNLYSVFEILSSEVQRKYVPKYKEALLTPAIEYISKNLTSHYINIPQLASMCNISETYFRKIFKSAYGMSPITYINSKKIEMAEELLDSNVYSISEVAELLGYSGLFSFSRDFKKYTGMTPGKYSKRPFNL